jgi:ATP-binding cassette subfamily C protein CydCD
MSIPAARRVALVGPSGAGKSSVVNTLLRFWALEGGEARLGGTSLERLRQETPRRMIAWVAQDTHLFNTTIRGNIAFARPEATESEITSAARAAQLGDWIDSLPDGLDTKVGEQGAQLSGGQRQRLALARDAWTTRNTGICGAISAKASRQAPRSTGTCGLAPGAQAR